MEEKNTPETATGKRKSKRKGVEPFEPRAHLLLKRLIAVNLIEIIEEELARTPPQFGPLDYLHGSLIRRLVQSLKNGSGGCLPGVDGERLWAEFWISTESERDGEPSTETTQKRARAFRNWLQEQYLPETPVVIDKSIDHVYFNNEEYANNDPIALRILTFMVENHHLLPLPGQDIYKAVTGMEGNEHSFSRALKDLHPDLAGLIVGEQGKGQRLVF